MEEYGKVIEVDFKEKRVDFTFQYRVHLKKMKELEEKLSELHLLIYDITKSNGVSNSIKKTFEEIYQCIKRHAR